MEKKSARYRSDFQKTGEKSVKRKVFEDQIIDAFVTQYSDKSKLNTKVSNQLFEQLLDDIGHVLQVFASNVVNNPENFPEFNQLLIDNPVPPQVAHILTKEFRVFCLSLNAAKQFIGKEQSATDRVLLGGEFKKKLQDKVKICIVTGEELQYHDKAKINYHHPVRDGRIPIPLSKIGHDMIEGQTNKQI